MARIARRRRPRAYPQTASTSMVAPMAVRTCDSGQSSSADDNPLQSKDPSAWARIVEAVGPASILLVIDGRMGPELRRKVAAEDVWQDTLLHAWRDRDQCEWTGVQGFRRWLLGIADNRIRDARDFFGAAKRSGRREQQIERPTTGTGSTWHNEPVRTTTPSRMAVHREQAEQMRRALGELPQELRDVLQLRLFESLMMEEVADRLGIGLSAAKHRYRKAAAQYRARLFQRLGTRFGEKT
jgi:RNA polymerase sigma factor (sigma-70 family)